MYKYLQINKYFLMQHNKLKHLLLIFMHSNK